MHKSFLVFFFAISCTFGFGQRIETSAPIDEDFSLGFTKILGAAGTGYFVQSGNLDYEITSEKTGFRSPKYKIGFFNKALGLVWEKPLEPTFNESELLDVFLVGDNLAALSFIWSQSNKSVDLFVDIWDTTGRITNKKQLGSFKGLNSEPFDIKSCHSLHKDFFAFSATSKSDDDRTMALLVCFDYQWSQTNQLTFIINQPYKSFNLYSMAVSDSGKAVLLGVRSDKARALSSKRETNWFAYLPYQGKINEYPIGRGLEISTVRLTIDEFQHEAICAGFYADQGSYIGAGILNLRLSLSDSILSEPLSQNTVVDSQENLRLKGARNKNDAGGLSGYPLKKVIPRGDGGIVLVAESSYIAEYSYFDSFSQTFTRRLEYNYGDIVLFSLNRSGQIEWSSSISKNQTSMDDGGVFSSYCMMTEGSSLGFFFSEPISKRSRVLCGSLSQNGVANKTIPLALPEGTLLLSEGAKQVGENELLVPVLLKRKLHLVRISI
jgi:hypothetical protein